MRRFLLLAMLATLPALAGSARAETYVVTDASDTLDDAGQPVTGTFRWALAMANVDPGSTVEFNIDADGPIAIRPSATPAQLAAGECSPTSSFRIQTLVIRAPMNIDGFSQNRFRGVAEDLPLVEIDGVQALDRNGLGPCVNGILLARADDVTITGLAVTRFGRHGIVVGGSNDTHVVGNLLGVGYLDGVLAPKGNGRAGILSEYHTLPDDPTEVERPTRNMVLEDNLVSANGRTIRAPGIALDRGTQGAKVRNNRVGTDVNGQPSPSYGNWSGIEMLSPGHEVLGNRVASNILSGIRAITVAPKFLGDTLNSGKNLTIEGNFVTGNGACGVNVFPGAQMDIKGNTIVGGDGPSANDYAGICLHSSNNVVEENVIIGNGRARPEYPNFGSSGVIVERLVSPLLFDDLAVGNRISRNQISDNRGLGIEIIRTAEVPPTPLYYTIADGPNPDVNNEPGAQLIANHLQNRPVIASVVREGNHVRVAGTLWSASRTTFDIELFAGAPGSSQGAEYLDTIRVTTNAAGLASFSKVKVFVRLEPNSAVTATATNLVTNDTSELSLPTPVTCHGNSCR